MDANIRGSIFVEYQPGHLRFVSSVFDDLMKDLDITSNSIHVWYMYLHLVNFHGKCR